VGGGDGLPSRRELALQKGPDVGDSVVEVVKQFSVFLCLGFFAQSFNGKHPPNLMKMTVR
jgi:hypothetical protein